MSAGLKTLKPSPPKNTLPRPMATAPATKPIHMGMAGGMVMASRMAVMRAL